MAAGYDNGDVKLFDLKNMQLRWETNLTNGVCGLEFDRKDIQMNKLGVSTLEGGLYLFYMRNYIADKGYPRHQVKNAVQPIGSGGVCSGSKATVWSVRHMPQNRDVFVTSSGQGGVQLWKYTHNGNKGQEHVFPGEVELINNTVVSTQPINSFDWSKNFQGLGVCSSLDQTVRVILATEKNLD